jgi:methyltransferase (TIGR00027 family)
VFAGPEGFAMLAAREPDGRENAFLPVRTRFVDDVVIAGCEGAAAGVAAQVVLLGAGMDTRAFRLRLPTQTTVYELDHPEVLASKAAVLGAAVPVCRRRTVPADLRGDWAGRLLSAGFNPASPTVWVAEGVLFYLAAREVHALLGAAATLSSAGAVFAADVFGTGLLRLPGMRAVVEHRTSIGAPTPFCTDEPRDLLASTGWQPESVIDVGQAPANFGRLAPIPDNWDGGRDPTMRSYLLVGARRETVGRP